MLFNSASPVASHTRTHSSCVNRTHRGTSGVKSLASVIKMPLIQASSSEQKENASAQKVLTSNY